MSGVIVGERYVDGLPRLLEDLRREVGCLVGRLLVTLDLEIVEAALRRGTFPYVGLIGSTRKWKRFRQRLLRRGFAESAVDAVRCPIGVSQASKDPAAIALSTATELVEALEALTMVAGEPRARV